MSQLILFRVKSILHFNPAYLNCKCNLYISQNKKQYYLVTKGRKPGLYTSWKECEHEVIRYPEAQFKKFKRKEDVLNHLQKKIIEIHQNSPQARNRIDVLKVLLDEYQEKWRHSVNTSALGDLSKLLEENCSEIAEPICTTTTEIEEPSSRKEQQNNGFTIDEDGYLVIYIDGACSNNGRSNAVAGIGVYFGRDNPLNTSMLLDGRCTNNRAEITAATAGLQKAHLAGFKKVKMMTDSEFVIHCSTAWLKRWKKNGWRKMNGDLISNKEELVELDEASRGLDVKWVHVPAHQGVEGNEAADKLARQCIEEWKRSQ